MSGRIGVFKRPGKAGQGEFPSVRFLGHFPGEALAEKLVNVLPS